jgi:hypothetical protein
MIPYSVVRLSNAFYRGDSTECTSPQHGSLPSRGPGVVLRSTWALDLQLLTMQYHDHNNVGSERLRRFVVIDE